MCTIRVAKTKALISFAVTAKLICVFVFAYADSWFSHEAAQLYYTEMIPDVLTDFQGSYFYILIFKCIRY